jgi:hypothetical protein
VIAPVPVQDVHAGIEGFRRDLERALGAGSLLDRGWTKPDALTLLVSLFAVHDEAHPDLYLLRLYFDHYPKGPPSAQFVNPLTLSYSFPQDAMWVPKIESSPTIHFHPNYNNSGQLICSSTTLEFYKVNHDVAPENVWSPERMNFLNTIAAIKAGLIAAYYRGRSTP